MFSIIDSNYETLTIYWPCRCGCSIHWEPCSIDEADHTYCHCICIFQNILKYIDINIIVNNYETFAIYWPCSCGCSIYWEQCSINETDHSILSLRQYIEHNNIERVQWALNVIVWCWNLLRWLLKPTVFVQYYCDYCVQYIDAQNIVLNILNIYIYMVYVLQGSHNYCQ